MPHPTPAHKSFADRTGLYQEITDRIIAVLEQGRLPWVQPWGGAGAPLGLPRNAATGRPYSGINILILWGAVAERGFSAQTWLTFRQALAIGGHVRKGEKGTSVVYADRFIPYRERTRAGKAGVEPEAIPFLKRFTVFNADQCEDLPAGIAPPPEPLAEHLILPQAEALIRATGADIRIGGNRAFYVPGADYIQVPPPAAFFEPVNWHRTVCHELGHWTGAATRLNRDLSGGFGSSSYAREELVALSGQSALVPVALGGLVQVANRRDPRASRSALTSDGAARVGGACLPTWASPGIGVRGKGANRLWITLRWRCRPSFRFANAEPRTAWTVTFRSFSATATFTTPTSTVSFWGCR
jgi:antirestriction protein ArdC